MQEGAATSVDELLRESYRERLGIAEDVELLPDLSTLQTCVELHLKSIPFENISLHMTGEREAPIPLERSALMHKIFCKRRGGCCLELNGLFSLFLEDLGFPVVQLVPCFVAAGPERGHKTSKKFRTIASHFIIMVGIRVESSNNTQDAFKYYMVDVGLGEPPLGPWPYHAGIINGPSHTTAEGMETRMVWDRPWVDGSGRARKCIILEWKQIVSKDGQEETTTWEPRLQWDIADAPIDVRKPPICSTNHTLSSFSYVIDLLCQPRSSFARKMIICKLSRDAKVSLSGRRLKITSPRFGNSVQCSIKELSTEQAVVEALKTHLEFSCYHTNNWT